MIGTACYHGTGMTLRSMRLAYVLTFGVPFWHSVPTPTPMPDEFADIFLGRGHESPTQVDN